MNKRPIVAGTAGLPLAIIVVFSISTAHADVDAGMSSDTGSLVSGTVALDLLKDQASLFEAPLPQGVKWNDSLGIEEPTDGVSVRVEPFFVQKPGTDVPLGVSQQAVHPNKAGTMLYAQVMMAALKGVYK